MDRREALKKLAVGGAIAAGASIVISSTGVAFTGSLGDTGLIEGTIPGPSDPIDVIVDESAAGNNNNNNNNNKALSIAIPVTPQCASGQQGATTYQWQITSFIAGKDGDDDKNNDRKKAPFLDFRLDGGQRRSTEGGVPTGFTQPSALASSGTFRRNDGHNLKKDSYVFQMRVTWQCNGASARVEALYEFTVIDATFQEPPQTLEWNIISR